MPDSLDVCWTMARTPREEYFLDLADIVAGRSTCLHRQLGAVLVRSERIISTGYNGAPQGLGHCLDLGCLCAHFDQRRDRKSGTPQ